MRLMRRLLIRLSTAAAILIVVAALVEYALETRDVAKYVPGQSFASVNGSRIRYQLRGAEHPGATVIVLAGVAGSVEQTDKLQSEIARDVPALAYDRGGFGFSEESHAHSAVEQADELLGLLHALKIEKPVVIVAFSDSNKLARVFASRYPDRTAGLYLIDPWMPEFDAFKGRDSRRVFWRWVVNTVPASTVGYIRLTQRLQSWNGPPTLVERRAQAVLARRSHYWALAREWWVSPVSSQQTINATVPPDLPIEILCARPIPGNGDSELNARLDAELAARSARGRLVEFESVDHGTLIKGGPIFDPMVARIKESAKATD